MSKRKNLAYSYPSLVTLVDGREDEKIFIPDFKADTELFEEVNSNNGVSIALQKHELANVMRMRLQEINTSDIDLSSFSDDNILDAMFTRNDEIEDIYSFARQQEKEFVNNRNNGNN